MSLDVKRLWSDWECLFSQNSHKFQSVNVACSGGLDSIVLLHLLWSFSNEKKIFSLGVIHVNFGLRGKESLEDQKFVEQLSRFYGLLCKVKEISKEERLEIRGESVQEWARRIRYQLFDRISNNKNIVALAHHSDDLAENVILRMSRGSSPGILPGMSVLSGFYWRPLLCFSKKDILNYAKEHKLKYREDSSNEKLDYSRNRVRTLVLPELEKLYRGASKRIIQCALETQDVMSFIEQSVGPEFETALSNDGILLKQFKKIPDGVVLTLLFYLFKKMKEPLYQESSRGHPLKPQVSKDFMLQLLQKIREKTGESENPARGTSEKVTKWEREIPSGGLVTIDQERLWIAEDRHPQKKLRSDQHDRTLCRHEYNLTLEDCRGTWWSSLGRVGRSG